MAANATTYWVLIKRGKRSAWEEFGDINDELVEAVKEAGGIDKVAFTKFVKSDLSSEELKTIKLMVEGAGGPKN